MRVPPDKITVVSKYYGNNTATYEYNGYQFEVDREDWHDLEHDGEIPEYVKLGVEEAKTSKERLNKLFVYGIFLGEDMRKRYGMSKPQYDTVPNYITVGDVIVQAIRVDDARIRLTGLVVDMNPDYWGKTDDLEEGYDRIKVKTSSSIDCWMYVAKEGKR